MNGGRRVARIAAALATGKCTGRRFHHIRGFEKLAKVLTEASFTGGIAVNAGADGRVADRSLPPVRYIRR